MAWGRNLLNYEAVLPWGMQVSWCRCDGGGGTHVTGVIHERSLSKRFSKGIEVRRHVGLEAGLEPPGDCRAFQPLFGRGWQVPIDLARGFPTGYYWLVESEAKSPSEITEYQETEDL